MKTALRVAVLLAVVGAWLVPGAAHADRRNFVWNYEAKTMQKDEVELEYYLTASVIRPEGTQDDSIRYEHQAEIEYGVTDNLDVAMYQVFRQVEGEELRYRGYKARARYRFGDIGERFIDPLVYLEVHHNPFSEEIEFEQKIVLAKNISNWILAFNMTFEEELKFKDDAQEYLLKPGFAAGYQFRPWITLGLEFEDRMLTVSPGGFDHNSFHAGPTISLAGQRLWWNLGALIQMTDAYSEEARYQVRTLMGIYF